MTSTTFDYDRDTAVEPLAAGRYAATVSDRYSIGPYPNGGYVLGIVLAGIAREVAHPDPMAVSAHFLSPAAHAPAEVSVEVLRSGRSISMAEGRLLQDGVERLRVLASYGDLSRLDGPTMVMARPPDLPPVEECIGSEGTTAPAPNGLVAAIRDRFEQRIHPDHMAWRLGGAPSGRGEIAGYVRFADGREPDTATLPLICDAFPPAVFDLVRTGWVPTIELTVLVRARPAPGWLRCVFRTRALIGGLLDEDGEVWDSEGTLVAQSRQLARANPPSA